MPGGKPGDHPYTDIVIHGWSDEVGQEMSDLVRELARMPGFAPYWDEVAKLLESCSVYWGNNPSDDARSKALGRLSEIKIAIGAGVTK